jgi:hypothetical protein
MIIQIEGFDQNNNFIKKNIDTNNKKIKDLGKWAHYDWYADGIKLNNTFNEWEEHKMYEVIYNNDYIQIYIRLKNKMILSPLINKDLTIEELKDILSIKDNIYFFNVRLNDNNTLEDYNINNKNVLSTVYSLSASPAE